MMKKGELLAMTQDHVMGCMDEILSKFKPGAVITVLVRRPGIPDADFIITNDDLDEALAMIERRKLEMADE